MWPGQIFLLFLFSNVFREAFTINFVHNVSCLNSVSLPPIQQVRLTLAVY